MKIRSAEELDFETGECVQTFESKLLYEIGLLKALPNPYVGNKRKILFNILKTIKDAGIKSDIVVDLFSGSACVSLAFKMMGVRVTSNDILKSSSMYAAAFVENNSVVLTEEQKIALLKSKPSKESTFVRENFSDRFTERESVFLDNYRANIDEVLTDPIHKAIAFANIQLYIMDKCFVGGRLNKGQVLARVDHRINHNRNKGYEMGFHDIHWYSFISNKYNGECRVTSEDALAFLKGWKSLVYPDVYDIAYIDPPYGGDQSDYATMFGFFESYIRQQTQDVWTKEIGMTNFCHSSDYEKHFTELIEEASVIPCLVISYNDTSWSDIGNITGIVKRFKKDVSVKDIEYDYQYRDKANKHGTEYLILAR